MDMNRIEKQTFTIEKYTLENGESLPVTLGYETYGELNEEKSNVILVPHYFSGSSHVAGRYAPEDSAPGYWDALIGPGKAIDTNQFFVISTDNLANVQAKNPKVITTGPRTINLKTGKIWGLEFPAFTYRDMAGIQHEFLTKQLGIHELYAVIGASAGGFIALHWAVNYPDKVERVIGVVTNPQNPMITSIGVAHQSMRAIALDPKWNNGFYEDGKEPTEGLHLAVQMMNTGVFTPEIYQAVYKRESQEHAPYLDIKTFTSYESSFTNAVVAGSALVDASHWYYTCRATMLHDIAHGHGSLEEALNKITANVLMISCTRDLLQPTIYNRQMVDIMKDQGKQAELFAFESINGHMAGLIDTHLFGETITKFLQ